MERFLYRLAQSRYRGQFVLKGALMFLAWGAPLTRPTRDIDLLGLTNHAIETLVEIMQEVCSAPVEPDGITFEPDSVTGERIKEDADYEGVRIALLGTLGKARLHLQIDIGFADVVSPAPIPVQYPTILSQPAPQLRGYPRETTVAEKLQAMVYLGQINSRMKDFYDLWVLAEKFEFDGRSLQDAIARTFRRRDTPIPIEQPMAFSDAFATEKQSMWKSFLHRNRLEGVPDQLSDVISTLRKFLVAPIMAVTRETEFLAIWQPGGPWNQTVDS